MNIKISELNRRIRLQKTADTTVWRDTKEVWASIAKRKKKDLAIDGYAHMQTEYAMIIRSDPELTSESKIIYQNHVLDIKEIEETSSFMTITAIEVPNE